MYSITPVLHPYENKRGLHRITLQVICNGIKTTIKTDYAVQQKEWSGKVIRHPQSEKYNYNLNKQRLQIENNLLEAFKFQERFSKKELDAIVKNKIRHSNNFYNYTINFIETLKGKLSPGRLRHYEVMAKKVKEYNAATDIQHINSDWLLKFENHLRSTNISNATIRSNMNIIKVIVRSFNKKADFSTYKNVKPFTKKAEFLTEEELAAFEAAVYKMQDKYIRRAGFYFLLSCYTGLRISDAMSFNITMVSHGEVRLYAGKNDKLNSIPVFTNLQRVIDYFQETTFPISQGKVREGVNTIALVAGISKHVKYHTSRHTFCTRMLQKGFTIPEVADMAGDTIKTISETYAHVDRSALKKKILEKM